MAWDVEGVLEAVSEGRKDHAETLMPVKAPEVAEGCDLL